MTTMGTTSTAALTRFEGGWWAMRRSISRAAVIAKASQVHTCNGTNDERLRRTGSAMAYAAGRDAGGDAGDVAATGGSSHRANLEESRRHP
jgi:hypothetical protein